MSEPSSPALAETAARIVAAYVSHNSVSPDGLGQLLREIHASLASLGPVPPAIPERPRPAVPIGESITRDHLISLEDGRRFKALAHHLASRGLTPEQYRAKWGLPADYPMVAPSYSERRSQLAKQAGLGRKRGPVPKQAPRRRK